MVSTRLMAGTTPPTCSSRIAPSSSGIGGGVVHQQPIHQQVFLLDLPVELLDKIFAFVGYKKVAQIRVVSRQMNQVCSLVLNSTFQKLQNQIMGRFQNVKGKMPRRESARRNHPLACECDIIETCHMRLSLLQMTFGKHIERKHCCFFPGGILDEVFSVLNHIQVTPSGQVGRPYKVTDELFDLSTMAMEYFKENIEPTLPDLVYFSKSFLDFSSSAKQNFLESSSTSSRDSTYSSAQPSPPPHMVLRKGIRKIKQGMKKYNNQLTVLRNELRSCKKKATEQSKQLAEQQKMITDQQKQTIDYQEMNDKKTEELSQKFSTLLQELNKCKTELQYWRSKSPATSSVSCTACGHKIVHNSTALLTSPMVAGLDTERAASTRDEIAVWGMLAPPPMLNLPRGSQSTAVSGLLKRKSDDGGSSLSDASNSNTCAVSNSNNNCSNNGNTEDHTVNSVKKVRRAAATKGGAGKAT